MARTIVLLLVVAAAIAGGVAGGVIGLLLDGERPKASTNATPQSAPAALPEGDGSAEQSELTPAEIYRSDASGVAVITDTQTEVIPSTVFTPRETQRVGALGSGFVIDHRGDIVTNEHVVHGATGVRVGFASGASYPATIVGTDPSTDIAVVRVRAPASALHPLVFANSSAVVVGEPVYAIGNPFGLDRTMTAGIVSATGRDIQAPNDLTIANAIQTDASINHGNSGGPLLDRFGRVVGVNAQIEGGTVDANVGIGFAIPSDTARSVAHQLASSGHATHAWLGVEIETIEPDVAQAVRGLPAHGVAVMSVVKGSPAAHAGLVAATRHIAADGAGSFVGGDAIVAAGGTAISSSAELGAVVARHKPGDTVAFEVVRDGVSRTVDITLGNAPA